MRVGVDLQLQRLGAVRAAPGLRPRQEEALVRGEAVDLLALLRLLGHVECVERDEQAAEIADVLAERQLTVHVQVVDGDVAVVLLHELRRALLEQLAVLVGPPADVIALRVELRALVVEAVHQLVADDAAHRAVVHRVVGLRVEERRLHDGGREHDLVLQRVVVRVDGLRRHAPFGLVDRLADLRELALRLERRAGAHVVEVVAARDGQRGIIAPLVGVADLRRERGELLHRLLLRLVAHPLELLEPGLQRLLQVLHEREALRLRFRRERARDVQLAERLAEVVARHVHHPLPAWTQLLRTRQCPAIELEVLVHERARQVRRGERHEVPAQVGLPLLDRDVGDHLVRFVEEARLRQRERVECQAVRREVLRPRQVRRLLVGVRDRDDVVVVARVAQRDLVHRRLREARFHREDPLRLLLRGGGFLAGEREQLLDVRDVLVAQRLVLGARLQVVLAFRQAEAALHGVRDVHRGILEVAERAEAEQRLDALRVPRVDERDDVFLRLQRVDLREVGLDRVVTGLLDARLIHRRGVEVADLLRVGARLGGFLRALLEDLLEEVQVALAHLVADAPGRVLGRDRVGVEPAAVGVAVEVRARRGLLVEVPAVEAVVVRVGARRGGERNCDGQRQRRDADTHGLNLRDSEQGERPAASRWARRC